MKTILKTSALTVMLMFFYGCVSDNSAEMARNALRTQGIPFTSKAFTKSAGEGKNEIVELFLKAGMDINIKDDETALSSAIVNNRKDTVAYLLGKGADPNEAISLGSPLLISAKHGLYEISKLLLDARADVSFKTNGGTTPLIEAVKNNHIEVAELLIQNDADINEGDSYFKRTPIFFAAQNGNVDMIFMLLEHGADSLKEDIYGNSPIDVAASGGHAQAVGALIEKGCKLTDSKNIARLAVLYACGKDKLEVLQVMLEKKGLDPNCFAPEGIPLLSWCIKNRHYTSAKLLIDAGASLEMPDKDGETPLDYALSADNEFLEYFRGEMKKSNPTDLPTDESAKKTDNP